MLEDLRQARFQGSSTADVVVRRPRCLLRCYWRRLPELAQLARWERPEVFRWVKMSMADSHWMILNAPSLRMGRTKTKKEERR